MSAGDLRAHAHFGSGNLSAVLRPLLFFVAFVTVLLAMVTTVGRGAVLFLDRAEGPLNAMLDSHSVELRGLRGSWHRLNPVIHVDHVRFDGGGARGVRFELDLIRSAFHGGPVARRFDADRMDVVVTRDDAGWRVGAGADGELGSDHLVTFLRSSREIAVPDVRLRFVDVRAGTPERGAHLVGDPALLGEFSLGAKLVNRRFGHLGSLTVRDSRNGQSACGQCGLTLDYHLTAIMPLDQPSGSVRLRGRRFEVPEALGVAAGFGGFEVAVVSGNWELTRGQGAGRVGLHGRNMVFPAGKLDAIDMVASGTVDTAARLQVDVEQLAVTVPPRIQPGPAGSPSLTATRLALSGGHLDLEPAAGQLRFRFDDVDVAPVMSILRASLGDLPTAEEWLTGLRAGGRITTVQGEYDYRLGQLNYGGSVVGGRVDAYKGVPMVRNLNAAVVGTERGLAVHLGQRDLTLGFLDIYDAPTDFNRASGRLLFHFRRDVFALRGENLALQLGDTVARGSFALASPPDHDERRLMIDVDAAGMAVADARPYVPNVLSPGLLNWIDDSVHDGWLERVRVAFHGHLSATPEAPMHQVEVALAARDARLRFHPEWPEASGLNGLVRVTMDGTHAAIDAGRISGIDVHGGTLFLPPDGQRVDVEADGRGGGGALMALVDTSPLVTWLPVPLRDISAEGTLGYRLALSVPIGDETLDGLSLAVDADLEGVALDIPAFNLALTALDGPLRYQYPYDISSDGIEGRQFDRPVSIGAGRSGDAVEVVMRGRASGNDLENWLAMPADRVRGEFDFDARLLVDTLDQQVPELIVRSDLVGFEMSLPGTLGKPAAERRDTRVTVSFLPDYRELEVQAGGLGSGWAHFDDATLRRGAVAFGHDLARTPEPDAMAGADFWIGGRIDEFDLTGDLASISAIPGVALQRNWRIEGLTLGQLRIDGLLIPAVDIDAESYTGHTRFGFAAPMLAGEVEMVQGEPIRVGLDRLHVPGSVAAVMADSRDGTLSDSEDTTAPALFAPLNRRHWPDMDVRVEELRVAGADFGRWQFALRREAEAVAFRELVADVRGVHIDAPEGLVWFDDDVTAIKARGEAGNLTDVFTQWGMAPSMESRWARFDADLWWPGSPLDFEIATVGGQVQLDVSNGRFLDVQAGAGAQRVLSLLNLAKIAKRMTMDFSDVFGRGISFDRLSADFNLADGTLSFNEPMRVDGTGSAFRISGRVDLVEGMLTNEMVVTLPVSESLPWYAAYLAVANPLMAGAVLVGERIFRSQIEQMSSARYRIDGPLDDPRVSLVQVFPSELQVVQPDAAQASGTAMRSTARPDSGGVSVGGVSADGESTTQGRARADDETKNATTP